MYRGRFAPSPTGDLHLGSAACALVSWLAARSAGGAYVLRVEDIDTPRVQPQMEERQLDDLRWLGLDWDEGPFRQSQRIARYDRALEVLRGEGLTYLCDCSRADIARAASAPHEGEEGPRYPGTCRDWGHAEREWKRAPAVRLRVPDREIAFDDRWQGRVIENVWRSVGDFVLRRGDGVYAYQLAVVVDDLEMGITEVVRGADLLSSTARQILLGELLGGTPPRYAHHALVVSPDGTRLAKRAHGVSLRDNRAAGVPPQGLLGLLAKSLGLLDERDSRTEITPRDLLASFDSERLSGRKVAPTPFEMQPAPQG